MLHPASSSVTRMSSTCQHPYVLRTYLLESPSSYAQVHPTTYQPVESSCTLAVQYLPMSKFDVSLSLWSEAGHERALGIQEQPETAPGQPQSASQQPAPQQTTPQATAEAPAATPLRAPTLGAPPAPSTAAAAAAAATAESAPIQAQPAASSSQAPAAADTEATVASSSAAPGKEETGQGLGDPLGLGRTIHVFFRAAAAEQEAAERWAASYLPTV